MEVTRFVSDTFACCRWVNGSASVSWTLFGTRRVHFVATPPSSLLPIAVAVSVPNLLHFSIAFASSNAYQHILCSLGDSVTGTLLFRNGYVWDLPLFRRCCGSVGIWFGSSFLFRSETFSFRTGKFREPPKFQNGDVLMVSPGSGGTVAFCWNPSVN